MDFQNEIQKRQELLKANIISQFSNSSELLIEKANVGDTKMINGKLHVYKQIPSGKFDWRKAPSDHPNQPKKDDDSKTDKKETKVDYSNDNISSLWNSFSSKTRKLVLDGNDDNDIDKKFDEQTEDMKEYIISKFKQFGITYLTNQNEVNSKKKEKPKKEESTEDDDYKELNYSDIRKKLNNIKVSVSVADAVDDVEEKIFEQLGMEPYEDSTLDMLVTSKAKKLVKTGENK